MAECRDRQRHDIGSILYVILGQVAVQRIDAALKIDIIGGHVLQADLVIDTLSRAAYTCHDIRSRSNGIRNMWTDPHHLAKVPVTRDEEVTALRGHAVFGLIDFFIGAVNAHAQNLHQYTAPTVQSLQTRRNTNRNGKLD